MRNLAVVLGMVFCCAFFVGGAAGAPLPEWNPATLLTSPAQGDEMAGAYDPYVGHGDLITRAVPVCCCSSNNYFCEENPPGAPGTPCKYGSPCRCTAFGTCAFSY
jgi:hypothetical protein